MIKLQIEDATLSTLDPSLLPHVQWKSIRVSDLEGVDKEILNKYLFKMSTPVVKSLLKNSRVQPDNMDIEEWKQVLTSAYDDGWNILKVLQLPYDVIQAVLEDSYLNRRYGERMAETQLSLPVADGLKLLNSNSFNNMIISGSNPALRHFMFTDEGIEIIKKRGDGIVSRLRYLTTEEYAKFNVTFKNRTINPQVLRRANACSDGQRYCRLVLKELGRDSITWNEAMIELRVNPTLRKRSSLMMYVDWVYERSSTLESAN
jgi:hypothetical protein